MLRKERVFSEGEVSLRLIEGDMCGYILTIQPVDYIESDREKMKGRLRELEKTFEKLISALEGEEVTV